MQRRKFLAKSSVISAAVFAGCTGDGSTGDSGEDIQDSDGDGVIDSEDYAPQDPQVQEKADLKGTTSVGRQSTTATSTSTTTQAATPTTTESTGTATTTESPTNTNSIQVRGTEFHADVSRFVEYDVETARVTVHPDGPAVTETSNRELWILAAGYSQEQIYGTGQTPVDLTGSAVEAVVNIEWDSKPELEPIHYWAMLAPGEPLPANFRGRIQIIYMRLTPSRSRAAA